MAKWTTEDIMNLVQKLTRHNQSANISAGDLFYNWNAEQNMYYTDIVGRWQAQSNGKAGQNTGLILNQTNLSDLAPFTIPYDLDITNGLTDKPDDFEQRISIEINGYKVWLIRADQKPSVVNSSIDAPSVSNNMYYAIEYEDQYEFLPSSVTTATLYYLASPTDIKWAFTYDDDGRQVYDEANSVQPKWKQSTIIEITKRTLNHFGVSWKDADFANAGKSAQLTGN